MGPASTLILISNQPLDYKTPHNPPPAPRVGTQIFEGISPLWPSLPGKSNKAILFYFTQNCLQDLIQFWGTEAGFSFRSALMQAIYQAFEKYWRNNNYKD